MTTNDFKFDPKAIRPSEHAPMVSMLLSVIKKLTDQLSQQSEALSKQAGKIDELLTEIRQLEKLSKKPKLRASSLPKDKTIKVMMRRQSANFIRARVNYQFDSLRAGYMNAIFI